MDKPFATGFFFGLGFSLAVAITSTAVALITIGVLTGQLHIYLRDPLTGVPLSSSTSAPPTQLHRVCVPPKDKDTCFRESGGEVNMTFLRCRTGYSYLTP